MAEFPFKIDFDNEKTPIYIAMCFPFSYSDQMDYLLDLEEKLSDSQSIYFKREHLTDSFEGRRIDLLTISSFDRIDNKATETLTNPYLFPSTNNQSTAQKFKPEKKVVLLTCRVHPGETPASYSMKGTLDMLTDPSNKIGEELRRLFIFKVIPMINPDGVARGHFRTDCHLQDLNRHYDEPTTQLHSPVYAIKELINYLYQDKRLCFFCDYHSHGLPRNCYFYGNFMKYHLQVETKTFAKLMELTCPEFTASDCDFSFKSMGYKIGKKNRTAKTKVACSRVVAFRSTLLIHSFTLEIGYHGMVNKRPGVELDESCDSYDDPNQNIEVIDSSVVPSNNSYFTQDCYQRIGRNLLETLLDLYGKHPVSPVANSEFKSIENIRSEIAAKIKKDYKKTEKNIDVKLKNINQFIGEHYSKQGLSLQPDIVDCSKTAPLDMSLVRIIPDNTFLPSLKSMKGQQVPCDEGQARKSQANIKQNILRRSEIQAPQKSSRRNASENFKFQNPKSLIQVSYAHSKIQENRLSKPLPSIKSLEKVDLTLKSSIVPLHSIVEQQRFINDKAKTFYKIPGHEDISGYSAVSREVELKIVAPKVGETYGSSNWTNTSRLASKICAKTKTQSRARLSVRKNKRL